MASHCDSSCFERVCNDGMFEYTVQIVGEDRHPKIMDNNGLVIMGDVDCYTIRLTQRRIDGMENPEEFPCAKISIDGKRVG